VRDVLQLQESACVNGDVVTEKMNMQTGSVITGQIKMGKEAAQIIKQEPNIEQFQGIAELQNQIQENGKGRPAGHLEEGGAPPEAKQTGE
jgi:cytoskeletal protein CcmA (bactofilin family)